MCQGMIGVHLTLKHMPMHTQIQTYTHMCTRVHTCACICAHTRARTHTLSIFFSVSVSVSLSVCLSLSLSLSLSHTHTHTHTQTHRGTCFCVYLCYSCLQQNMIFQTSDWLNLKGLFSILGCRDCTIHMDFGDSCFTWE